MHPIEMCRCQCHHLSRYRHYATMFGVNITGEELDCRTMGQFSSGGSANAALYWAPEQGCTLVTWQTAFSALVEGNYNRCLASVP